MMPQPRTARVLTWSTLLATLLSTAACVRVSATQLGTGVRPQVPPDSVSVFATTTPPDYTEVAVLRAKRFLVSDTKVLRALRERAGQLGANGVLLLNTRAAVVGGGNGTHVVLGGPADGSVIVGSTHADVDEFERAVAIRWNARERSSSVR